MVQTYGTVKTRAADSVDRLEGTSSEVSALLGNGATTQPKAGHATILSCVSNLANTIIGSGECVDPIRTFQQEE